MSGSKDIKERKAEVLNNSYRKDGLIKFVEGDYRGAIKLFTTALRLSPSDVKSLVYRSKCHKKLLNIRKAIDDVDTALHIHNLNKEALLQKASLLYHSSDYELALVYYTRGHKHYPKSRDFLIGIEKAEMGINKGRKSRGRRMKLTEAGDLTFLVHKIPESKPFVWKKPVARSQSLQIPSATFNTRPLCQLIRIHKTPAVTLAETPQPGADNDSAVLNYDEKRPESRVVKTTMGKLYKDKKYLQHLVVDDKFPAVMGSAGSPVGDMAEDGLNFLLDRAAYWDRLGPLPPPPPARRFRSRFSGSTMSVNSVDSFKSTDTKRTWKSTDSMKTFKTEKSSRYSVHSKTEKQPQKPDPSKVEFKFPSMKLFDEFHQRKMTEIEEEEEETEVIENSKISEPEADQRQEDTAKKSLMDYMIKELQTIDEDFSSNRFRRVQDRCESCLELLGRYSDSEIPDKFEIISDLYSYLGNASMQLGNLDLALRFHQMDLTIGDQLDKRNIRYRALGNTGRVLMMKGKHNKALDMFTRKAPLCITPRETASLFHEIGNCFLVLNNFHSARDAGRKSLKAAEEAGNIQQQLQACVLVGLAEVNMKKYEKAHNSFERALDYAKSLGDERAETAMKKALVDVNRKIALKIRKSKTLQHEQLTHAHSESDVTTARTSIAVE